MKIGIKTNQTLCTLNIANRTTDFLYIQNIVGSGEGRVVFSCQEGAMNVPQKLSRFKIFRIIKNLHKCEKKQVPSGCM